MCSIGKNLPGKPGSGSGRFVRAYIFMVPVYLFRPPLDEELPDLAGDDEFLEGVLDLEGAALLLDGELDLAGAAELPEGGVDLEGLVELLEGVLGGLVVVRVGCCLGGV